ncbi:TIGR03936 family radical SAM-associated protein [Nocardiopsis sp. N85]|uniref:TIGR03936 family radical SAM-associated protein n=2 Tax=Nocardiopsis sp. N85 TaxID=3029400 RepID=UPI00237F73E2|nr:TIGR03936 family radical SAM-associated protein [Nocardiopsis sp. N85]MDE3722752.1 TIGR03936 family radical SAM-associated protein [Nocardiopsis sp. N85]
MHHRAPYAEQDEEQSLAGRPATAQRGTRKGVELPPAPEGTTSPSTAVPGQRLRVRYAKRGRMRFASHRDIARVLERALRRADVPVAFSAGFSPHPKISYTGAAPTGVASEAEYLELTLTEAREPDRVGDDIDAAMPDGIDVVEVVEARRPGLADRLQASEWRVELTGVGLEDAERAVRVYLAAESVEVERMTKKGRRRFDTRPAVVGIDVCRGSHGRAPRDQDDTYAILRMVVRHTTPAVRPDDVLNGLRHVADLAPPSSPMMTRLAQGPLDETTGAIADPLAADRNDSGPADDADERGDSAPQPSASMTGPR